MFYIQKSGKGVKSEIIKTKKKNKERDEMEMNEKEENEEIEELEVNDEMFEMGGIIKCTT